MAALSAAPQQSDGQVSVVDCRFVSESVDFRSNTPAKEVSSLDATTTRTCFESTPVLSPHKLAFVLFDNLQRLPETPDQQTTPTLDIFVARHLQPADSTWLAEESRAVSMPTWLRVS